MHEIRTALRDVRWVEVAPGVERGELRNGRLHVSMLRFAKGSRSADHQHPGGEELFLVSGRLRVGAWVLEPGDHLHTPDDGVNDAEALEDSLVFQVLGAPATFRPRRPGDA